MGPVRRQTDWEQETEAHLHSVAKALVWLLWVCVAAGVAGVLVTFGFVVWFFLWMAGFIST